MQDTTFFYSSLLLIFLVAFKFLFQSRVHHKNLPPRPPSLPILGHLHLLKQPLHRTFHNFSQKYGPIISLQFGSRPVIIVSSPSIVVECFTKNDIILANRPCLLIGKHISYNHTTMVDVPYGDHWRNLRRISAIQIFSTNRLNLFLSIQKDEIKSLLIKLARDSYQDFFKVELKSMFAALTFNILMRMVAGKRYYGDDVEDEEEARPFRALIAEVFNFSVASNPMEFLPILNWFDRGDYEKRLMRLGKRMDAFLQGLIDEHRSEKEGLESTNTMIDHLLSLQETQPEYYTDQIIKGLVLVILLAGTDTSEVTLEWDPKLWDDATNFKPERFEKEQGHAHKLMPFGMGRRACPGAGLAQQVMGLTLGSLIQHFEWERVNEKEIDMTEGNGLTMPKAEPLEAMCKARRIVNEAV